MAHEHIAESSIKYHSSVSYSQFIAAKETNPFTIPTSTTGFANSDTWVNGSDLNNWSKSHNGARLFRSKKTFYETIYGQDNDNVIAGAAEYDVSWMSGTDFREGIEHDARRTWTWDGVLDETIYGGGGNDIIYGYKGNDLLYGQADNDALYGGEGNDVLDGGNHNDVLFSGPLDKGQKDNLTGGPGSDTFFLGESELDESNSAVSGAGIDWVNLGLSVAGDVSDLAFTVVPGLQPFKAAKELVPMVFDVAKALTNGGKKVDGAVKETNDVGSATILDFNPTEDVIFIPLPDQGEIDIDFDSTGDNLLKVYHDTNKTDIIAKVQLSDEFDNYLGSNDNIDLEDSFYKTLENNAYIIDNTGKITFLDDTNLQVAPEDRENLNSGFLVLGAHNGVNLEGSGDKDYQYGTQFDDVIVGHELSDSESAADLANDDSHDGDIMYGFGGDDEFSGGKGGDRIYGGDGSDTANYILSPGAITVELRALTNGYAEADDGFVNVGNAKDRLYSIENIIGSDVGNDDIRGDAEDNTFFGMGGNDTMLGFSGNDSLYGGEGDDQLSPNEGDDYVDGGEGNDNINGSWDDDQLYGGDGNDSIKGGRDSDTLTGGADADTFILDSNIGIDIITDFNSDEGDIIEIDTSVYGFSSGSDLSYNSTTGELKVDATGATIVTLQNPVNFTFDDIYLDGVQNTVPFLDEQSVVIGEYGTIDALEIDWQTINLDNTYVNPVVITSDPTYNGTDVAAIRLRNVDSDSFEVRILEPDYYTDNYHAGETVSYFVVEAGEWELDDGTRINAGLHNTDNLVKAKSELDTVDFTDNGLTDFSSTPTVLTQVQTFDGDDWVTTRVDGQSQTGFQVGMQEEESRNSGTHATETIGWLAIEDGASFDSSGDLLLQGGTTGAQVEENFTTINYSQSFDAAPTLIAKMASFDGTDPSVLRIDENSLSSTTGFEAFVQEDTSLDTETDHALESVSYLGFNGSEGLLTGLAI
ncbi:calcium-binding protein [Okeania sp. SIO1F9]|uniref:calcium-binding protein n=1 Tax=Okeania sp. SIO1F9 TaxID=2607813 RepID=UPI00144E98D9|nr:hypothetical protein [Okeania sp. SIO1F9]NET78302.1 hypothetical protein [Okeania sp. SIO1F9]